MLQYGIHVTREFLQEDNVQWAEDQCPFPAQREWTRLLNIPPVTYYFQQTIRIEMKPIVVFSTSTTPRISWWMKCETLRAAKLTHDYLGAICREGWFPIEVYLYLHASLSGVFSHFSRKTAHNTKRARLSLQQARGASLHVGNVKVWASVSSPVLASQS